MIAHLSNRNLELESVVVGIAAANGMKTWLDDDHETSSRRDEYKLPSSVAVAAMMEEDVGGLAASKEWKLTAPNATQRLWTDDYADIVGAMVRKLNYPNGSRGAPIAAEVR